jgi:CheY-like chemotaxis protein
MVSMNKVMMVDDDETILFTFKISMEDLEADYKIDTAMNGKECIDKLQNNETPDIILMDIMMPVMDGWETIQKIREDHRLDALPIIVLTARTDHLVERTNAFDNVFHMEKPFESAELKKKIDEILSKSHFNS